MTSARGGAAGEAIARARTLLELRQLTVDYGFGEKRARAVDGVDLTIHEGEIARARRRVRLRQDDHRQRGDADPSPARADHRRQHRVRRARTSSARSDEELRRFRWRNVSMVLQSAMNALNPVMRIGDQFLDAMRAHERIDRRRALARTGELLELVGIDRRRARAYPHELSGGMRQRVVIAMALALKPELVILDEPTTALDVVVQREILQQVEALKRDFGFAVLFITHDLSLLLEFADRIAIMYAGEIVESAPAERLGATRSTRTRRGFWSRSRR